VYLAPSFEVKNVAEDGSVRDMDWCYDENTMVPPVRRLHQQGYRMVRKNTHRYYGLFWAVMKAV
jgi:hypothetical protein